MTIYFDVSAAVHRRAGLGRYAESLARALLTQINDLTTDYPTARLPDYPTPFAFFYNREHGIEPLAGLEHIPAVTVNLGYKPWRMLVWLGQLARVGFDRLLPGATLFHATEHLLLPLRGIPTVLTVHDLIFRRYPQHHKPLNRWYLNATMPLFCRRAHHIIAVSEQTKRDVMAAYGVPADKITVIYEAADPRFRPQPPEVVAGVRRRYRLPDRYLLFVGTIEPRKNLGRLLTAFERLHAGGLTDALVIVGKRGWLYEDFFARLEGSPAKQAVIFPGFVPDADLPALYAGAQALAFPSEFEGFGLPVLEAMACGTPVVCSNTSSLPEITSPPGPLSYTERGRALPPPAQGGGQGGVGGPGPLSGEERGETGAALLVDPLDVDALTDALRRVLADPDLAAELRARGLEQAARFSWARAAQETLVVYRRVMTGTR
ncbi:MAG: glycosyltransferase family 4 protein [Chloroflexaceae bacterium]|nr:glycosyltransferase family 4 protein [Chloroflexaceae bacterium]